MSVSVQCGETGRKPGKKAPFLVPITTSVKRGVISPVSHQKLVIGGSFEIDVIGIFGICKVIIKFPSVSIDKRKLETIS